MTRTPHSLYWDSNIFLSFVNQYADRVATIELIWKQIAEGSGRIVTSALSIAEVAYAAFEIQQGELDPNATQLLDDLWDDPSVLVIDPTQEIMYLARTLIRTAKQNGWSLRPADAIHLATARLVNQTLYSIQVFHTYDDLKRYASLVNISISEPTAPRPTQS